MSQAFASLCTWTLVAALAGMALGACSEEPAESPQGTGGVAPPAGGTGGGAAGAGGSSTGVGGAGAGGAGGDAGTGTVTGAGGAGMGGGGAGGEGAGTGGAAGAGAGGAGSGGGGGMGGAGGEGGMAAVDLEPFSFFLTSFEAMIRLSGSEDGFGGDLTYGEADGLAGADKICTEIAEYSMPGASAKGWRAFLSVSAGPDGEPVHAIERIGEGPWYDRLGRLVAMDTDALTNQRPEGADQVIANDLPNEYGVPNHKPDPNLPAVDNHHVLTGSDAEGRLYMGDDSGTCGDWTQTVDAGRPRFGFSWSIQNRIHWISGGDEAGCGAGFDFEAAGPVLSNPVVGSGGGYGGIYCFALMP